MNVTELVTSIFQNQIESEPDRAVEVSIQTDMQVVCDHELLGLALTLLIENAWKFTGGVKTAAIEFGQSNSGHERTLWLKDNGVGFDMAYSDKIFLPFSRLHSSEQFAGLGVGLAYVEAAVFRNLAMVSVQSKVGTGTTVFIKFSNQNVVLYQGTKADSTRGIEA